MNKEGNNYSLTKENDEKKKIKLAIPLCIFNKEKELRIEKEKLYNEEIKKNKEK